MISSPLGTYPTPVERVRELERPGVELWVKRDDLTHPEYGGNKVRKLEHALTLARSRRAQRIVTIGAVGSHHVLATALFGGRAGFEVDAILVPQPRTPLSEDIARAGIGLGMRVFPAGSMATGFVKTLARGAGDDAFVIPVGGSSVEGALGYVDAALELAAQIRAGEMPKPDLVVATCGSGGTVAGIALGLAAAGLDIEVLGVCVSDPIIAVRSVVTWLLVQTAALTAARAKAGPMSPSALAHRAQANLTLTPDFMGRGYAYRTEAGDEAVRIGASAGIGLDPTYTGKTFAATLAAIEGGGHRRILYWHTLSSAPLAPLLEGAPPLPDAVAKLLR